MSKTMDRRLFLRGLIAAPIVAVALKASIEAKFVPELKAAAVDELSVIEGETLEHQMMKEALMERGEVNDAEEKIFVRAPQKVFNPNSRIWKSVINEAEGWAAAIAVTHPELNLQSLNRSTKILARAIDRDIKTEEITASTDIIVELPKVLRTWLDSQGRMQAEIAMGLDKVEVLGIEQYKVGYIGNHDQHLPMGLMARQTTRPLDDHIKDTLIYQPERQIRSEMAELREQLRVKTQKVEAMASKRQDEITAHQMNSDLDWMLSKNEKAREEKAREFIEAGALVIMDDAMDDDEWFAAVAPAHDEYDMGSADGWAKTLSRLLWG